MTIASTNRSFDFTEPPAAGLAPRNRLAALLFMVVLTVGAIAASPAQATLYDWTIVGTSGFSGSGTFTVSNTLDPNDTEEPGGFLVTAMTGTFKGATVTLDPVNTLTSDNDFYPTGFDSFGLKVDDDGWTWRAGTQDYNMFLSVGTDSHGNTTENLLIGFPGISGGSKKVTFTATAVPSVPEPATLGVFGIGMIGLALSRRRKAA